MTKFPPPAPPALTTSLLTIALAATTLLTVSCGDPYKAPGYGHSDPLPASNYPRITVEDSIQPWVGLGEPVIKWDPLQVTVPVRALHEDSYDLRIQYRYVFFDGQGTPLRLQQSWRYDVLPATRAQIFIAGTAMDDTARDWRLEIRSAR